MNPQSNAIPDTPMAAQGFAPVVIPESRLLYWSVMRELWESRSIYIAPLAVAALTLVGHLIATIGRAMWVTNLAQRGAILEEHVQLRRVCHHGDHVCRRSVLLSRRAAWRASRS